MFSFYILHNGNWKREWGGVKFLLGKPINSAYHGKGEYLIVRIVVVIVTELSGGRKISKIEAIIIPIFQMRKFRSSMVRRFAQNLMTSKS